MEVLWSDTVAAPPQRPGAPPAAMQQDPAYGAACAALGSRVLRAAISDGRTRLGAAQLVHRRLLGLDVAVCTRGPVWTVAAGPSRRASALATLRRTIPLPRFRAVFFTPDAGAAESPVLADAGLARVMTPYTTATIDLARDPCTLRAAMHQKWRNRLVAAERAGLRVARSDRTPARYEWLLKAETAQQRARRYAALPTALVPAWQRAGGALCVLMASHGDETVAAMLFLIHGRSATYHIGWSNAEGRRLSAGNLVMWTAMLRLARAGVTELDLGGLNTDDVPGIARFKLGTGARVRTLCGTWFGR